MAMIYIPNKPNASHLEEVKAAMEIKGTATIRAFWTGESYIALEGSHRVAAAHALGVEIAITKMDEDDCLTDHDFYDLPASASVADVLAYIDGGSAAYNVEIA